LFFRQAHDLIFPVYTRKLGGINNKIKVIKRQAYGFHDMGYFILKLNRLARGNVVHKLLWRRTKNSKKIQKKRGTSFPLSNIFPKH